MTEEPKQYVIPPSMPWSSSSEQLARHRKNFQREIAFYRENEPEHLSIAVAQNEMFEEAYRIMGARSPREIRKTAALVIRCGDCAGRAIGWVAWVGGRPLFMGNEEHDGKRAVVTLLDEFEFAAPDFCCRVVKFKLGYDVPLDALPGPGGGRRQLRVVHADAKRCALDSE